jgi:hypothetical protein
VQIKADKILKEMVLAKQSRLSVSPVTKAQFDRLLELAETKAKREFSQPVPMLAHKFAGSDSHRALARRQGWR